MRFFDDAVSAGKVGYPGLPNFTAWQVQKAVDLAEHQHLAVPVTLQPSYSLLVRDVEFEIVPACLHNGLGMLPWGPLGGWLWGKYTRDQRPEGATPAGEDPGRGMESFDRVGSRQRTWDVLEVVQDVAEACGVSMPQVALAWLAARPAVSSVIVGARTTGQLRDDLGAVDVTLDPEDVARLDAVSDPGRSDYPYGDVGAELRDHPVPRQFPGRRVVGGEPCSANQSRDPSYRWTTTSPHHGCNSRTPGAPAGPDVVTRSLAGTAAP